jgi:hypothetical protein
LRQAVSNWQFQYFCKALAWVELPTLEEIGIELVAVAGRTGPQTPPPPPQRDSLGRTEVTRYGSNNHQFMIPLLLSPNEKRLFLLEADDLPVMIYHCRLLHEEARTLKASPNTQHLKQELYTIHPKSSNNQTQKWAKAL